MKTALALAAASVIILGLALWIVWPASPNEPTDRGQMIFAHKSAAPPAVIDPPFGFHWGDSMAHVEALLGYSTAAIVMRAATGRAEIWTVEGLIQPGLKNAMFTFQKNALTAVRLHCQYEAWPVQRYGTRLEELKTFFQQKYGNQQAMPAPAGAPPLGYVWRRGETELSVSCPIDHAPGGKPLSVCSLVMRYHIGNGDPPDTAAPPTAVWQDTVISTFVRPKLAPSDQAPTDSDFVIADAKLLNTSSDTQAAYLLQLAVKRSTDVLPDPARTTVEVNFYDRLPNGEITLTDANVNYDWKGRRDWKESNPENLSVSYIRKGTGNPPDSGRRFFGHVTTVYYDGRLESVEAEPVALINLFPIRTLISPFERAKNAVDRKEYSTAVPIYRSAADRGNLFALENLAWFYARGNGVQKDVRQAAVFYERAALQNTPRALNALAWFLATCEDASVRNGAEAVGHATKACEITYWREWKYIDTLSAAWAEMGDFKRAVEFGQQALQLPELDEASRNTIQAHLAVFQKRQPIRE